jgi:acetyl-CoA carboxylase biotin carboxyl carrier protein
VGLKYDEIAEILKVIDSSSCDELIVETGDLKLVVRRNSAAGSQASHHSSTPIIAPRFSAPSPVMPQAVPPAGAAGPAMAKAANQIEVHQIEVVAPMIGTFYRAPSPEGAPFVEIGSAVRKGQPLCLIEVMKLFTTIATEHDGRVVQIGAQNGELVEYGRVLFVIEPV